MNGDIDLSLMKGKFYPMVLRGASLVETEPPEVRVSMDGSVEFINFTPDAHSRELFEILGKEISHDWHVKAGCKSPDSIYNVKPK